MAHQSSQLGIVRHCSMPASTPITSSSEVSSRSPHRRPACIDAFSDASTRRVKRCQDSHCSLRFSRTPVLWTNLGKFTPIHTAFTRCPIKPNVLSFHWSHQRNGISTDIGIFKWYPKRRVSVVASAGGQEEEPSTAGLEKPIFLKRPFWLQVVIGVLTLGFVDAGYSGDWSRIGVLSTDQENLLKTAAFFVVPASAAGIWSISRRENVK